MIVKLGDNIISPLGLTSRENFEAVRSGKSSLCRHEEVFGLPEAFCGSLIDRDFIQDMAEREIKDAERFTFFEKLVILSIQRALREAGIDAAGEDVIFIVSTTKGNVECLKDNPEDERAYLGRSAEKIASYFGNPNPVTVVSNACISGVCAQITGIRDLLSGRYRYAVVAGCDVLSKFIVSGFQSFKALSDAPCRPFDNERLGLNLGEAVATMVIGKAEGEWEYVGSAIHNDANHISGPSRTGEGSYRVLRDILEDLDKEKIEDRGEIGFVNVHGTSTAYNDEMESIALTRAGLEGMPVNGLKGYYGHTLGAAGIVETILSMLAIEDGTVLATRGFSTPGTSCPVNVSNENRPCSGNAFVKILSGFGGTNAGIAWRRREGRERRERGEEDLRTEGSQRRKQTADNENIGSLGCRTFGESLYYDREVRITPEETVLGGKAISNADIAGLYREFIGGYPKFFKMDMLSRLGFVAAELLLREIGPEEREHAAVVLFNRNGSLITDRNYQQTLSDENYFPSPALFVYTLANIVTGEIAIWHKIFGETSFYVLPYRDEKRMREIVENIFLTSKPSMVVTGWLDYENPGDYIAEMKIVRLESGEEG